jgi:hypothetical protein
MNVVVHPVEEAVGHAQAKIVPRRLHHDAAGARGRVQFIDVEITIGVRLVTRFGNRRCGAGQGCIEMPAIAGNNEVAYQGGRVQIPG